MAVVVVCVDDDAGQVEFIGVMKQADKRLLIIGILPYIRGDNKQGSMLCLCVNGEKKNEDPQPWPPVVYYTPESRV
jgi:hypothetical protein